MLTPLPGSEDHKVLWQQGSWMDADLNKYDLNNRVTHHPVMSDDDWDDAYRAAWQSFYSLDHVRTILRRAAAHPQGRPQTTLTTFLWFKLMTMFEGVHPLEGGAFRRKSRRRRVASECGQKRIRRGGRLKVDRPGPPAINFNFGEERP
jgi:hypothetical protein